MAAKKVEIWRCVNCLGCFWEGDLLTARSPFDPDETLTGCPNCKTVDDFERVCDEPGCARTASNGFPVDGGYRHTCFEHGLRFPWRGLAEKPE